jgi:hypothetical protein
MHCAKASGRPHVCRQNAGQKSVLYRQTTGHIGPGVEPTERGCRSGGLPRDGARRGRGRPTLHTRAARPAAPARSTPAKRRLTAPEHRWGEGYLSACRTHEGEWRGSGGPEVAKGRIGSLEAKRGEETAERGPALQPVLADVCPDGSVKAHPCQDRRDRMGHRGVPRALPQGWCAKWERPPRRGRAACRPCCAAIFARSKLERNGSPVGAARHADPFLDKSAYALICA